MQSKGFLIPTLYLTIAAAAIISVLGLTVWGMGNRLDACRAEKAVQEAVFKQKLDEYDQKLAEQARLVEKLILASKDRQQASQVALQRVQKEGVMLTAEVKRLRALRPSGKPSDCPAGAAVLQVRAGLKQ